MDDFVADATCPHLGGNLSDGTLEGTLLTCPRHNSQFDLRDGRVVRWTDWHGATLSVAKALKHPRPLGTYPLKIKGNTIPLGPKNAPPPES
jgi:3-phenylpropionate/trans-cinnamate dioxygenase ferredoxin subunit